MTDYNATLDTQIEPDAPLTSQLCGQFRDNPIATAEGSPGAPRIQTPLLETRTLTSQTPVIFTNLPYPCIFEFEIATGTSNATELAMQVSRDNGATWEPGRGVGSGDENNTQFCYGTLAFQGISFVACIGFGSSPAAAALGGNLSGVNIGVAGGFVEPNAFRFTIGNGSFTGTIRVYRGFQRGT